MTLVVQVANHLAADPALLNLRTRRLLVDVPVRYGCSRRTAIEAIALARRGAGRAAR